MYDYQRRTALQHYRSYEEALKGAIHHYGVKPGHVRQIAEARRLATQLDQRLKEYKGLNPDDAWAGNRGKLEKLWGALQKLFVYCFGLNPPALDSFI